MTLPTGLTIAYGDTVLLTGKDRKEFIRTVLAGQKFQCHLGEVVFDELVGQPYGVQVKTNIGHGLYVLPPSLDDILRNIKRETQIIYPKDLGYIALKLSIREETHVIEAGTGSGALTSLLAILVGETGHVYSYERREKMQNRAIQNVKRLGVDHRVTFYHHDIGDGFHESEAHALFLDVPNPQDYLEQARAALRGGGFFGAIVPTANQMIDLLSPLYNGAWYLLEAEELIRRPWKTIPPRVRPDNDMVGHTGFLIFARAVDRTPQHLKESYTAQQAIARQAELAERGTIDAEDEADLS